MNIQKEESPDIDYLNNLYELKMKLLNPELSENEKVDLEYKIEVLELQRRFEPFLEYIQNSVKTDILKGLKKSTQNLGQINSNSIKEYFSIFLKEYDHNYSKMFESVKDFIKPEFIESYVKLLVKNNQGTGKELMQHINNGLFLLFENKGKDSNLEDFYNTEATVFSNIDSDLKRFVPNDNNTPEEVNKSINRYIGTLFDEDLMKEVYQKKSNKILNEEKEKNLEILYKKLEKQVKVSNKGNAYESSSKKSSLYGTINQINDLLGSKSPFISEAFIKQIKVEKILEFKDFSQDLYLSSDNTDIPNKRFINNVINGINAISNGETVKHYVDRISDSTGGDNKKKEIIEKIEYFIM